MNHHKITSEKSLSVENQNKDNHFQSELITIFQYLKENIATASMVSAETSVPQKNICRYKRDLEKEGLLWEIEKTNCKKTGYKAWYLTTNKDLMPKCSIQLKLF